MTRRGLLLLVLLAGLVGTAHAATIFSETFENVPLGDISNGNAVFNQLVANGWSSVESAFTCNIYCSAAIVAAPGGRAGRVYREQYRPLTQGVIDDSHNAKLYVLLANVPSVWVRTYLYLEPYDPSQGQPSGADGPGTEEQHKWHYLNFANIPYFLMMLFPNAPGNLVITQGHTQIVTCPNGSQDAACNFFANTASGAVVYGQWQCIEYHFQESPALMEVFRDGVQTHNYSGSNIIFHPQHFMNLVIYRQGVANLNRYNDDLVIADTRVGCAATLNPPGNPLICRGAGCTPAMVLPLPLVATCAIGLRRWVKRRRQPEDC